MINMKLSALLGFFLLLFVSIFATLTLVQLVGLGLYAPEIAGFMGGTLAVVGIVYVITKGDRGK